MIRVLFFIFIFTLLGVSGYSQSATQINDSANYYIRHGRQLRAVKILSDLEKQQRVKQDPTTHYLSLSLLGKAFYDLGDPTMAGKQYQIGIDLAKNNGDSIKEADFLCSLAGVNVHGISLMSLHQYNLAKGIYERHQRPDKINLLYFRMGTFYSFHGKIDSMFYYYDKIIPLLKENRADSILAQIYMNIGVSYSQMNDQKNHLIYIRKALSVSESYGDKKALALMYANYAWTMNGINRYDSSKYYAVAGLRLAEESNNFRAKIVALDNLIDLAVKKEDYKTAFHYNERNHVMWDSFKNIGKDVQSLKNQLDIEFKDKENKMKYEELLKEKEAEEKLRRQTLLTWVFIVGVIFIAITAIVIFNRLKVIQKQKHLIEAQKESLEHKNELIEEKQKEILDSIRYAKRIQLAQIPSEKRIQIILQRIKNKT